MDDGNGGGEVGLVGEDQDGAVGQLLLGQEGEELVLGLVETLGGEGGREGRREGRMRWSTSVKG